MSSIICFFESRPGRALDMLGSRLPTKIITSTSAGDLPACGLARRPSAGRVGEAPKPEDIGALPAMGPDDL
eukprot:183650-Pleurochrysis_carterae.AAC.1